MKTSLFVVAFLAIVSFLNAGNDPVASKLMQNTKLNYPGPTEWDKEMTDGGFFLNIGLIVPSKLCYMVMAIDDKSLLGSDNFKAGPALELGNMFKIADIGDNALGIRATWLSGSMTTFSENAMSMTMVQGSVLKIGPYFTYPINDEIAIDGFFQFGPSYAIDIDVDSTDFGKAGYLGATYNIGAGCRYKMFNLGFDTNFGKLKDLDKKAMDGLDNETINDFHKIRASYFRIFLGFRF